MENTNTETEIRNPGNINHIIQGRNYWARKTWLIIENEHTEPLTPYLRMMGRQVFTLKPGNLSVIDMIHGERIRYSEWQDKLPAFDVVVTGCERGFHVSDDGRYLSVSTRRPRLIKAVKGLIGKQRIIPSNTIMVGVGSRDEELQTFPGKEKIFMWLHELIIPEEDLIITKLTDDGGEPA